MFVTSTDVYKCRIPLNLKRPSDHMWFSNTLPRIFIFSAYQNVTNFHTFAKFSLPPSSGTDAEIRFSLTRLTAPDNFFARGLSSMM
jgi:hypothetical protein